MADVADDPLAAHVAPALEGTAPVVDPSAHTVATIAAVPSTGRVTATAGETIWSVAGRNAVAPGALLRHHRSPAALASFSAVTTGATDALAAGRPLGRAETLVVPTGPANATPAAAARRRSAGDTPVVARPELAALEPAFDRWADHFGVPRDLLKALAWVESGWDNDSRAASGGIGIGRLQPLRAQYLADQVAEMPLDPTVAVDNIALTAAQLRVLLDETSDVASAVAAHRQGITATRLSGVDPALDGYVEAVLTVRLRFA